MLRAIPCKVFAGTDTSFILCQNGSLYGFGRNQDGQLGTGNFNHTSSPQRIDIKGEEICQVAAGT